ncbi:uncharacterized protein FFNC_07420 [Fusarium fujikuroi]|nr:uncharacterized protein FFC1_11659 [Fusarium fujikuroi]SCO40316.1 uncharacterized protein FFNC_07420 [Fusarium fujikuroi]
MSITVLAFLGLSQAEEACARSMNKKNNPGSVSTAQHPVWLEADPSSSLPD